MEYALGVRVNEQLTLDAGTLVADAPDAVHGVVRPPSVPMIEQVLAFLIRQPAEPDAEISETELAQVTTALCLRYGTWFGLISDGARPMTLRMPRGASRIRNPEMARINVEASAGLARWLDLRCGSPAAFKQLVLRALKHLPAQPEPLQRRHRSRSRLPGRIVPRGMHLLLSVMTLPELARQVISTNREGRPAIFAERRAQAEAQPSRVLANALINDTWRNGPIETIHGGTWVEFPLDCCRLSPRERDHLLRHTITKLVDSLPAVERMIDAPGRTWPEKVLPFHLIEEFQVTPSDWTLTEGAWEVLV